MIARHVRARLAGWLDATGEVRRLQVQLHHSESARRAAQAQASTLGDDVVTLKAALARAVHPSVAAGTYESPGDFVCADHLDRAMELLSTLRRQWVIPDHPAARAVEAQVDQLLDEMGDGL